MVNASRFMENGGRFTENGGQFMENGGQFMENRGPYKWVAPLGAGTQAALPRPFRPPRATPSQDPGSRPAASSLGSIPPALQAGPTVDAPILASPALLAGTCFGAAATPG
jgi:hypothetical protein